MELKRLARLLRTAMARRRPLQRRVERSITVPKLPRRNVKPGSVWAVTMVRNEADVVGRSIRHLLGQGVDGVIVVDNLSEDATPDVLAELAREDGRVHVGVNALDAFYQGRAMSYLTWLAHRAGADWIILFDADEFWFGQEGTVVDALRQVGPDRVQAAASYDLLPGTLEGVNFTDPNAVARMRQEPSTKKVAIRPDRWVWVDDGNHTCLDLARDVPGPLRIAHVPHRSLEQRIRKVVLGAAALEKADTLRPDIGNHWRAAAGLSEANLAAAWSQEVEAARGLPMVPLPTKWEGWTTPF